MGHGISDLRELWTSKTRGNHMEQYDVVVVGAGNAGLSAAIQMALAGKKTLLIEQHNLPGGCCQPPQGTLGQVVPRYQPVMKSRRA